MIHQIIRILMATLGHPVFEPLAKPDASADPQVTCYCRASEADGRGVSHRPHR